MKTIILVALFAPALAFARGHSHSGSRVYVSSHVTKRGTYVPAHVRTAPDHSRANNWTTKGNVNPSTGKAGTKPLTK